MSLLIHTVQKRQKPDWKRDYKPIKLYSVSGYALSCYEALHTTGTKYIIEDIDLFLEARQHG